MTQERWLPVECALAPHEVSSLGRVRSMARKDGQGHAQKSSFLAPQRKSCGHLKVRLRTGRADKVQVVLVHRLVAQAFIPNPAGHPVVNHLNNDPADNRVENLEWCTQADNLRHARSLGRLPPPWLGASGESTPRAKLSDKDAEEIRVRYAAGGLSHSALAASYGVSKVSITRLLQGRTYRPPPPPPTEASGSAPDA